MLPPKVIQIDYLNNQGYVIADILEGGMGRVYKLYPVLDDISVVAMKTIKGTSSIKLFDAECESWLSIAHHPNIAKSFAFGSWEGLPSVIVDWYPSSLDKLHPKDLNIRRLKRLIIGTVNALDYAYRKKTLIHQDIKPANILIDQDGNARLSDFGLAKCVADFSITPFKDLYDRNIHTTESLSGTPYFMAPELWENVQPSIKTDIFSLGVTFYNALTGEHPYIEMSGSKRKIHSQIRKDVSSYFANQYGIEADSIMSFLKKCLDQDPSKRYADYREILNDLDEEVCDDIVDWTVDRSNSVSNVSSFYMRKGDNNKALLVLESVLEKHPNDVILISRLADFYSHIGNDDAAELYSGIAYNNLKNTQGLFLGAYDPSPAFVWVRNLIRRKQYDEAGNVVKIILGWEKNSNKNHSNSINSGKYAEIGWYYLYIGEFRNSFDVLIRHASRNTLDKQSSIWLVESAWLSHSLKSHADEIADKLLKLVPSTVANYGGELEFLWARVILGQYANSELISKLWKSSSSSLFFETSNLEKKYGTKAGALLIPSSIELQKPFVQCLDQLSTGEIHREFIEAF